jgi:hypothetical protein
VTGNRHLTTMSNNVYNTIAFNIPAEVYRLQQLDSSWVIPPYNVVSYGPF